VVKRKFTKVKKKVKKKEVSSAVSGRRAGKTLELIDLIRKTLNTLNGHGISIYMRVVEG